MMDLKIYKNLFKLCETFDKVKCITPTEYVNTVKNVCENVARHFINLQRHLPILQEISDHFKSFNNISININMNRLKVLFYILIFAFDPDNAIEIEHIFTVVSKVSYMIEPLIYYSYEQNQILTAKIASKYFDNGYVIKNFVEPIRENQENHRDIFISIVERQCKCSRQKDCTPVEKERKIPSKISITPPPTLSETAPFRSSGIPKTTYIIDVSLQKKLNEEYEKNRARSLKLLEKVRALPTHEPLVKKGEPKLPEKVWPLQKPKRIVVKDVPIKENLTTVLREAALYAKEKETCIKQITDILKGGVDTNITKVMEEEARDLEEKRAMEEIERNRLKCLLSHEEAIIAKCKVKERNKLKKQEILEESEQLMKQLYEWQDQEREKYKLYVEKIHEAKRNIKISEQKMLEEKQDNARVLSWETKKLIEEAMTEKEKELVRKIHIIKEIKAISQVKKIANSYKVFDRTECPSTGLLCEMSIAELEERLNIMKVAMQRQLDEKRKSIQKTKEEKQKAIADAKEFVERNRTQKEKAPVRPATKLEESDSITELRKKLKEAKQLRLIYSTCPCT